MRRALLVFVVMTACNSGAPPVGRSPETSAPAKATTTTATTLPAISLLGRVVDDSGRPVAGALVRVGDATTRTAPDGWFDIEGYPPSEISVSRPGWEPHTGQWEGGPGVTEITVERRLVRGVRVAGDIAGNEESYRRILDLADATAVNTLVFDTKQEGGAVLYDTAVADAHLFGAVRPQYDAAEALAAAQRHDLYTITRIVTFEDWLWTGARPADRLIGPWVDATDPETWRYPLALAEEACELGFDEIMFDYVRFPSGSTAAQTGQLDLPQSERVGAMAAFLAEARRLLHPMGCAVNAAVFGIVVSSADDQGIGQRPEEISVEVDVLSPMVYPSHYSDGWLGFSDPNDHPYDVTADALDEAMARIAETSTLRPWLQAFWWTPQQIRRSIDAAEDRELGWMLWNVRSNYPVEAIPTDDELGN